MKISRSPPRHRCPRHRRVRIRAVPRRHGRAQPFDGYLFGGNFGHFHDFNNDCCHTDLGVDDHSIYGGRIGYNFNNLWEVESEFAQTNTHLTSTSTTTSPKERIGDLRFQYFMGYMTFNFGSGRFVPYFTLGSGAANLEAGVPGPSRTPRSATRRRRRRHQVLLQPALRAAARRPLLLDLSERPGDLRARLLHEQHLGDEPLDERRLHRGLLVMARQMLLTLGKTNSQTPLPGGGRGRG